ncbi:FAD/NAD(P)-binding domain-containing protein [Suillus decipiens]|nr:FAD/NAD(P)-binding domain-containing protein [Suillus decipiens]
MSLKTIAVCDESELQDGQMKQVDFEGVGKVVLYRLNNTIHATSAFCTHYGAPLAKGVLTADGRVVCPWHGACFSVRTGDIEDAPAPAAIHSFKAAVANGKINVTADPSLTLKNNMSRSPKLLSTGVAGSGKSVVIIGGGSATFYAIESLREHGYPGNITILSQEKHAPIDRTKLSKALITDSSKLEWRTAADLKIKYGTTLRTGVTVTSVDTSSKLVVFDGGKESMSYETLILAMGGTPRRLPISESDLENVYTFRNIEDSKCVDAGNIGSSTLISPLNTLNFVVAQEGKRMVVIGSSFIGMELVVAVAKRGLASIDVISTEEHPFQNVLGKEVGQGLQKYHESQGVKFHMGTQVEKIIPSESDPSLAAGVVVNGQTVPADFIVMGVGVAPATEFLKQSGFQLEKDGGIKVDQYLRVQGQDNVYAVGDIAWYPQQKTGESRRIEHWNVAGNHGRAVGKTIAGDPQPFAKVPVFWSAQGQQLRYCGLGADYDDVIIHGNPGEMKFIAYYVHRGEVVAVSSMQNDPVVSKASELLRLGRMPSPAELKEGKSLLSINISTASTKPCVELI